MFGSKRLAKRSIVGTKISALWQDGRFYPGVIQKQLTEGEPSNARFSVRFDDGFHRHVSAKEVIGPGFHPITSAYLKQGQKVYLTLNGREVSGLVINHDPDLDQVLINIKIFPGDGREICRPLEDVRLLESRKSARLQDMDTDYSKLADMHNGESKRRTVSHNIDIAVPSNIIVRSRLQNESLQDDHDFKLEIDDDGEMEDTEMMDEHDAAMVLTSLSCSPVSPKFPSPAKEHSGPHSFQDTSYLSSSFASSGVFSGNHSERSDPSPPLPSHLSESAPACTGLCGSLTHDDGIDLEEKVNCYYDDEIEPKRKRTEQLVRTMFQCTWKGCGKLFTTCPLIEKHVRMAHLGRNEDNETSDNEEEFYYTEIEVNVDTVTKKFSDLDTSSPPTQDYIDKAAFSVQGIHDHDYQKKTQNFNQVCVTLASSVPTTTLPIQMASTPINMPEMKRSLSWQNNGSSPVFALSSPIRISKSTSQEPVHSISDSPRSLVFTSPIKTFHHKKPRSEVRKCRKVYGMENRDMWCTQCKWKKACSRFPD